MVSVNKLPLTWHTLSCLPDATLARMEDGARQVRREVRGAPRARGAMGYSVLRKPTFTVPIAYGT